MPSKSSCSMLYFVLVVQSWALFVLSPATSKGQYFFFERLGLSAGLPHTEVNDVIQGHDHRMYVGTEQGLAVYDGREFTVYTRKEHLDSDDIHLLYADDTDRIWIASSGGGLNYLYQDSIYAIPRLKKELNGEKVYEILQQDNGSLLFVTTKDVVVWRSDEIFSVWDRLKELRPSHAGSIATLYQDSILYTGLYSGQIIKVNLNTYEWKWINSSEPLPEGVLSLVVNDEGNLFFGGQNGLLEFRNDTLHTTHTHTPGRCWDIDVDEDGRYLWLFSEGNGFGRYDPINETYEGYDRTSGLPTTIFFGGTVDRESNVWLASFDEGLIRFRDQSLRKYTVDNGLPSEAVKCLESLDEKVYVGTAKGLVVMDDTKIIDTLLAGKWVASLSATSSYVLANTLNSSYKIYKNGRIERMAKYVGMEAVVINNSCFKITTSKVIAYKENAIDTLPIGWVKSIAPLGNDYVFVLDDEVAVYDGQEIMIIQELDALRYGSYRSITVWRDKVLLKSDKHLHVLVKNKSSLVIKNLDISAIPDVERMNAIVATGDSLWMSGVEQYVLIDLERLMWQDQDYFTRFPTGHTFLSTSISNDGIIAANGKVYARSPSELVIFDPDKYKFNTVAPTIKLSSVKLFGKTLEKSRWDDDLVEFDVSENNLSFEMAAHTYVHSEDVVFRYRLVSNGGKADWIGPVSQREVTYSNLPDGLYRYEFIAQNGDGVWNEEVCSFSFRINKPFWKKSTFWLLVFFAAIVTALLTILSNNRKRLREQKELKTKLIEIQEQDRKHIARELHDSLGQKLMLIAMKAKEMKSTKINDMALSSLQETRNISQGLHPVVLDQLGLSKGIKDMLAKVDEYTDVLIDTAVVPIDDLVSKNDWIHVFRIVQELVSNSIKHAQATTCSVQVTVESKNIVLVVEDNGRGFGASASRSNGMGLHSVQDRLFILGASIKIDSDGGARVEVRIPVVGKSI